MAKSRGGLSGRPDILSGAGSGSPVGAESGGLEIGRPGKVWTALLATWQESSQDRKIHASPKRKINGSVCQIGY